MGEGMVGRRGWRRTLRAEAFRGWGTIITAGMEVGVALRESGAAAAAAGALVVMEGPAAAAAAVAVCMRAQTVSPLLLLQVRQNLRRKWRQLMWRQLSWRGTCRKLSGSWTAQSAACNCSSGSFWLQYKQVQGLVPQIVCIDLGIPR